MCFKIQIENTIQHVAVVGDLHGKFNLLKYKIKQEKITNTVIIVAGDCGFGFEKEEYYKQTYNNLKKTLLEQNVCVIFVRGNHDDKKYFDGNRINFKNFIAVPDYSIISINTESGIKNILCVGGGISIDRTYRIENDRTYYKKSYWVDEFPVYEPDSLNEISESGINIDIVVTHTAPDFAPLHDKNGIGSWLLEDVNLSDDLNKERETLTQIYNHIVKKDKHKVKKWFYGHFHEHHFTTSEENVDFIMLDMFIERNNVWDYYPIYF